MKHPSQAAKSLVADMGAWVQTAARKPPLDVQVLGWWPWASAPCIWAVTLEFGPCWILPGSGPDEMEPEDVPTHWHPLPVMPGRRPGGAP